MKILLLIALFMSCVSCATIQSNLAKSKAKHANDPKHQDCTSIVSGNFVRTSCN